MSAAAVDHVIFGAMIIGSGVIGVYFGCYEKSKTIMEYIMGDQSTVFPVIMSIIVTFTTPKTLVADPTDVAMFDSQLIFAVTIGFLGGGAIYVIFFLPVQQHMTGRSLFEYFERRHNKAVRVTAAIIAILNSILKIPILIFIPSMVMERMLGLKFIYSATCIVVVCLFYTSLGGLRAVLWTDTLQYGFFMASVIVCMIVGLVQAGGFSTVWGDAFEGDRLRFFDMGGNLFYERANFWSGTMLGTVYSLSAAVTNQSFYQRLYCVRKLNKSYQISILSFILLCVTRAPGIVTGLTIYTYFKNCHPLLTKEITRTDDIVFQFVQKMSDVIPGFLGLFCAGLLAASLSTMSSVLNTTACSIHDDIVLRLWPRSISRKASFIVMQSSIYIMGLLSLILVPLAKSIKSLNQTIITFDGLTTGANLGVFVSGMINPWVNCKGMIAGVVASVGLPGWLMYENRRLVSEHKLVYAFKFISTSACNYSRVGRPLTNATSQGFRGYRSQVILDEEDPLAKFGGISFTWYMVIGFISSLLVSTLVSLCTGVEDPNKVDPALMCPQFRWLLPKESRETWQRRKEEKELQPLKRLEETTDQEK